MDSVLASYVLMTILVALMIVAIAIDCSLSPGANRSATGEVDSTATGYVIPHAAGAGEAPPADARLNRCDS